MSLCCISDIESNLIIQGTPYVLVQVILHNGSHFYRITVLNNQKVLYDGRLHNKLKPISKTETFASAEIEESYKVSCLWYRKVLKKIGSSSSSFPVLQSTRASASTHEVEPSMNEESKLDSINKEPAPGKAVNDQSISRAITPRHSKRVNKLKKRYSPDQLTPKPPNRRKKKAKTKHQLPSKKPVISKCYHDSIRLSIREGGK
jgi:hypothetical protein